MLRKLCDSTIENGTARLVKLQPIDEEAHAIFSSASTVIIELGDTRLHVSSTSSRVALSIEVEVLRHAQCRIRVQAHIHCL